MCLLNPICESVTVLLILLSEVFEFYICAYRYPRLFLQIIGKGGLTSTLTEIGMLAEMGSFKLV